MSLRMSPRGELFVLLADPFRGRAEMRVLDSDGKYLRTIIPYPADTPEKRTVPVGHIEIDGRCQPVVFNGQGHSIYPLTAGLREQTMAWHPDGYLILASAVGSMCNHGPPRFLMTLHPEGGAPEGGAHIGPRIRDAGGFMGGAGEAYAMGLDRIAVSPDGAWIYVVQNFTDSYRFKKELRHGVYRLKWNQAKAEELWVGQDAAGSGDDQFNEPAGIAVDGQGRLFICDRGNNRVKVLASDGKLLDQFPCPQPEQIELHPKSGEIIVLSRENNRRAEVGRLFHFSAWKMGATKELAEQEVSGLRCMTLDPTSDNLRLWIGYATGWRRPYGLAPVTVADGSFRIGEDINRSTSLHHPSFIVADPERNRAIVFEHLRGSGHRSVDLETGEVTALKTRGSDLAMDARGNLYIMSAIEAMPE